MCAMQLRMSPLIDRLALHDLNTTQPLARDLRRVPSQSRCRLESYQGPLQLFDALKGADIVLLLCGYSWKPGMSQDDLFAINAPIVQNVTQAYASACPNAVMGVITSPINSMVPLVCEVMKQERRYNPDLIIGMATLNVITANSIVGNTHHLDPDYINVPVVGGTSEWTCVPVLSKAEPYRDFTMKQMEELTYYIRTAPMEAAARGTRQPANAISYAVARFTNLLARALLGCGNCFMHAYVASNMLHNVKYFTHLLQFGVRGIQKNLGPPCLNEIEENLLCMALVNLQKDIDRAHYYIQRNGKRARHVDCTKTLQTTCRQYDQCDVCNVKSQECENPCCKR